MTERIPLALLPGLLNDGALWQSQIESLADVADIRVADLAVQDSIAQMACSVLETMPERFALAGFSMGGYVAFEVLRRAPARIGRLALLDTKARLDTPEQTSRRRGLIELAGKGSFKGVTRRVLEMAIHENRLADEALTGAVVAMAERAGRNVFLAQQRAIMNRPDSLPGLAGIACPTLVLCGRQDQPTPLDCHEEMARAIPNARLAVIEDCGHLAPMERPAEVSAALRGWLTG